MEVVVPNDREKYWTLKIRRVCYGDGVDEPCCVSFTSLARAVAEPVQALLARLNLRNVCDLRGALWTEAGPLIDC
jgi:hypothetical protein